MTRILRGALIRSSYGTMGASAVTLVEDSGRRILVDVGHFGLRAPLLRELGRVGLEPSDIDVVVLTHLHWDHCLNVGLFERAQIVLGADELEKGALMGVEDGASRSFRDYLSTLNVKGIGDGYTITPNTTILYLPGHTPGHIALQVVDGGRRVVIAGDAIPGLRAYRRGVPDIVFHSERLARQSIERVKALKPDLIIPGHDPPFTEQGYTETDAVDIVLATEHEYNITLTLGRTPASKPEIHSKD